MKQNNFLKGQPKIVAMEVTKCRKKKVYENGDLLMAKIAKMAMLLLYKSFKTI